MKQKVLRNKINIPMFVVYRLYMELKDTNRLWGAIQDIINFRNHNIAIFQNTGISPALWDWVKTEIDKYN